jgi:hypothetical protein
MASPAYGRSWRTFAEQAGYGAKGARHSSKPLPALEGEFQRAFDEIPEARGVVRKVNAVLKARSPSRSEIAKTMKDLENIEQLVRERVRGDSETRKQLRAKIAEMKRRIEEKLLEVAQIEPTFNIASRKKVRVAVVKIGRGVGTIRMAERERWRGFMARAGFDPDPVFLPALLTGDNATAASVRVAAARSGAHAVLAYTTYAATTMSFFGESAAVLAFAKCMFVDTRTEYLYFNAEGECRKKRVSLPFTVCSRCLEEECVTASIASLRKEILHELERLQ